MLSLQVWEWFPPLESGKRPSGRIVSKESPGSSRFRGLMSVLTVLDWEANFRRSISRPTSSQPISGGWTGLERSSSHPSIGDRGLGPSSEKRIPANRNLDRHRPWKLRYGRPVLPVPFKRGAHGRRPLAFSNRRAQRHHQPLCHRIWNQGSQHHVFP